jgi:thiol-disulfide isomerase/thioredoxin
MKTAIALCALGLLACGSESGGAAPTARADGVGAGSVASTKPGSTVKPPMSAAIASARKICQKPPKNAGKKLGDAKLDHIEADGETALGEAITTANGKWTWVNLWAGWCQPCKEEMPLLKEWETKLASKLRVAYVSIDDDERLSKRFLNEQPKTGVRQSYFLKKQETRKEWLEALGFSDVPKLPLHILLDPTGAVSCVIEGAIDANDFAQVEALVSK